jgi:biotin carboxyl carrier protein
MRFRTLLTPLAVLVLVAGGAVGVLTRDTWRGWLAPPEAVPSAPEHGDEHDDADRIRLRPQARANLGIVVKPIRLQSYWRTIAVPGVVIERPGISDRGVAAPLAGVVKRIAAVPGDTVRPGDELFTLRLQSEALQTSQTELYKTSRELQINQEQRARLEGPAKTGTIPAAQLIELENQGRRLTALQQAQRQDLAARGLTPEQIDQVARGQFVTEIVLRVPPSADLRSALEEKEEYEVQELKVKPGDYVPSGQMLAYLARHQYLAIEGHAFRREVPLIARAAQEGWPLDARFAEEDETSWPPLQEPLKIRFLANTVEAASQTFPFYVPLLNQSRTYTSEGKAYRLWRFRPGQRVRLGVPVERFDDVFVLPAAALVRDGPDMIVFRQNGDVFERRTVRVLHEDDTHVVLANDGSVTAGSHVAHAGAGPLNRALKGRATLGGHGHDHGHDHPH